MIELAHNFSPILKGTECCQSPAWNRMHCANLGCSECRSNHQFLQWCYVPHCWVNHRALASSSENSSNVMTGDTTGFIIPSHTNRCSFSEDGSWLLLKHTLGLRQFSGAFRLAVSCLDLPFAQWQFAKPLPTSIKKRMMVTIVPTMYQYSTLTDFNPVFFLPYTASLSTVDLDYLMTDYR